MTIKPLIRKLLKITGIILGVLLVLILVGYVWFIHHAEKIIRDIVHHKSKGTVALTLKSISYNFSERRLDLKNAVLYNTDSISKKTAYHVTVENLSLQLHGITPLLFRRQLVIDSILINDPQISVVKSDTALEKQGSLTTGIGQVYNSIHKALALFEVGYFRIQRGKFTLNNRARADWQPVTLSNIDFYINNFQVGGDNKEDKSFLFSDNIVFNTHDQQITFPDGRYHMAFKNFRINVKKRLIELDDCTLTTTGQYKQKTDLHLFFDELKFTGIDFATLYETNTLKADSMYALSPVADLTIQDSSTATVTPGNVHPVSADSLIHQLGMNLQLKYMGIKNIRSSIVSITNGKPVSFSTKGDDFALRDVKIDRNSPEPVSIGGFDMAIRGYSGLTKDSAYTFAFDSIRIINSRVLLNNLSITSSAKAEVQRHHELPLFELDNLSWEELIFNRRIKAQQAILYNPVIHYVKRTPAKNAERFALYSILDSLDNAMSLERIRVINGNVSYAPNPGIRLLLEQVNLTVSSNQLLAARSSNTIGDAVDSLYFVKGSITTPKLKAEIRNGSFKGDGSILEAEAVILNEQSGKMTVKANGIRITGINFNDNDQHLDIASVTWKGASITLHNNDPHPVAAKSAPLTITAAHIHGANTYLSITGPNSSISTLLTVVSVDKIAKDTGRVWMIAGLAVQGRNLLFTGKDLSLKSDNYALIDKAPSQVNHVQFTRYTQKDSITAVIPQIHILPDLAALATGKIQAEEMTLQQPALLLSLHKDSTKQTAKAAKPLPPIHIKKLSLDRPEIELQQENEEHTINFTWTQAPGNQLLLTDIIHQGEEPLSIGKISLTGNTLSFARNSAHPLLIKPQSLQLDLSHTSIATAKHHLIKWSTTLEQLAIKNVQLEGLGKDSGVLHVADLVAGHLTMQAGQHHKDWLNHSPDFQLKEFSGTYKNNKNYFYWQQLHYDHRQRLLSLDTFSFRPVLERDAYVAAHPFQIDFIQLQTGRISIHNPDLPGYFQDTLAHISTVQVQHPSVTIYRDKRPPFRKGIIKPLPVTMIASIQLKLKIDSILIHNGQVEYEELSDKTGQAGKLIFTKLNASLVGIKSHNHQQTDSLRLQADAWLLDSVRINLRLHESYTDSLASFHMVVRVSPANLMVLNKVVGPLASVRIKSGHLDTLTLNAIGREHLSYGEMRMRYRKLYVQLLKAGEEEKRSFITKALSVIANTFVIKAKNEHKTGIVYFERLRDRSVFNYMIKMFLSGAGSSIGAKSNKKYVKHYKRELKRQSLPEIYLD
jgi:hypothetical protein